MQIYYFSYFLNNITGGHFEVLSLIGLIFTIIGIIMFLLYRTDGGGAPWFIIAAIGLIPIIMEPGIREANIIYQNVINKPFELISDQDDAFLYIKTYEIDSNKKQVYLESKVHSFHKSLEIENVEGKNIITRED